MGVLIGILCALALLYCIGSHQSRTPRSQYQAGSILMLGDMTANDMLDELELHDVSMQLRRDEDCYFEGVGFSYHSKDIVSGYKSSSRGSSMRVMKGYSIHKSTGQSKAIRETVRTEYPGRLFITNQRIVFLAERYGFDIGFDKLSNITMYDEYLEVFSGSRFYRVYTPHTLFIRDLITSLDKGTQPFVVCDG